MINTTPAVDLMSGNQTSGPKEARRAVWIGPVKLNIDRTMKAMT